MNKDFSSLEPVDNKQTMGQVMTPIIEENHSIMSNWQRTILLFYYIVQFQMKQLVNP